MLPQYTLTFAREDFFQQDRILPAIIAHLAAYQRAPAAILLARSGGATGDH